MVEEVLLVVPIGGELSPIQVLVITILAQHGGKHNIQKSARGKLNIYIIIELWHSS